MDKIYKLVMMVQGEYIKMSVLWYQEKFSQFMKTSYT